MKIKICTKCHQEKDVSEFHKQKLGLFGVRSVCKNCLRSSQAKEKELRLTLIPKGCKICAKCNEIKVLSEFYKHKNCKFGVHSECKKCDKKRKKIYRQQPHIKKRAKIYLQKYNKRYLKNPKVKNRRKKYLKKYLKIYRQKIEIKTHKNEYRRKLYNNDKNYRFLCLIRTSTNKFFKGKKSSLTEKLLGCSYEFARKWIEAQFTSEMNWNNIHIDHVRPFSSFNNIERDKHKACNWKNLQPLLEKDNLEKQNNWDGTDENLIYSRQALLPEEKRKLIRQFEIMIEK